MGRKKAASGGLGRAGPQPALEQGALEPALTEGIWRWGVVVVALATAKKEVADAYQATLRPHPGSLEE